VLDHAGTYRALFALVAFTGMRISEALGMLWRDVDVDAGILHVEQQLTRYRTLGPLKTEASRREIELPPAVVRLLRERWLASPYKGPTDLVWCTRDGRGLDYRNVGEAFRVAVRRSGVTAGGRLSLHSLRHGYASLLIGRGLPLLFISRQLGHSKPSMTLNVYAHEFARRESGAAARQALESAYMEMVAAGRR
jgi:integrase